jgi:hypothetical protein
MRDIQRPPLADPSSDSLGRLNGKISGPVLCSVSQQRRRGLRGHKPCKQTPIGFDGWWHPQPRIRARLRRVRRIDELKLAAAFDDFLRAVESQSPSRVRAARADIGLRRRCRGTLRPLVQLSFRFASARFQVGVVE